MPVHPARININVLTLDTIRDIKIYQKKSGYRFSIDALLLYDFVNLIHARNIADLGAGTGIIGILLAKRYKNSRVYLVELQSSMVELCKKNVEINGLNERIEVLEMDIRELAHKGINLMHRYLGHHIPYFDLIVSNPPFRRPRTGKISPTDERAIARHEIALTLSELLKCAARILKNGGRFFLIHHPERIAELINEMKRHSLEPKRMRFVHSRLDERAKMVLVEGVKNGRQGIHIESPLFIYNEDGTYTDEVKRIYGNF